MKRLSNAPALALALGVCLAGYSAPANSRPVRDAVRRSLARFGVSPGKVPATTRSYIWRMDNMHPKNGSPRPVSTSTYGFSVTKDGQVKVGKNPGKTKPLTRDVHFLIANGRIVSTTRTTHTNTHYWRSSNPGQYVIDYTLKPNHTSRFVSLARQNGIEVRQGDTVRTKVNLENGRWASTAYLLNDRGVLFVYAKKPAAVEGWTVKQLPGSGKKRPWIRVRQANQ
jgi:hypothetical protein